MNGEYRKNDKCIVKSSQYINHKPEKYKFLFQRSFKSWKAKRVAIIAIYFTILCNKADERHGWTTMLGM